MSQPLRNDDSNGFRQPPHSSSNSSNSSNNKTNHETIAALQVRNRFQLQIQHFLSTSTVWYPWRYHHSSNNTTKKRNSVTAWEEHPGGNDPKGSMESMWNDENDEIMAMQQWWKQMQSFLHEHVTVVLENIPLMNPVESTTATSAALQVVPFPSTVDPPFLHLSRNHQNQHHRGAAPTVTIPMTVLIPHTMLFTHKNDCKNEIYFQHRHAILQQIVTDFNQQQQETPQPPYLVAHLQAMDIRKSCIVLELVHNQQHQHQHPNKHHKNSSNESSSSWNLFVRKMQKHYTLQIVVQFQMSNIDDLQAHQLLRFLPNRNNNHHPSRNAISSTPRHTNHPSNSHNDNDDHPHSTTLSAWSVQYNYSITEDMIHALNQSTVMSSLHQHKSNTNINDAMLLSNMSLRYGITLIVGWCTQRGLYQSLSVHGSDTTSYFNDSIIIQMVQYLIYTKRIIVSASNKDPMTVLISFLTLLSETQWDLYDANYRHSDDDTTHRNTIPAPSRSTASKHLSSRRLQPQRTILIQPQYIGQSVTEIVQSSILAQRYNSMVQEEMKHRQKIQMKQQHQNQIDWKPITTPQDTPPPPLTLTEFLATTTCIQTPTLYHPSLQHNYLFRLSIHFMQSAQWYAKKSLACIYPTNTNVTISHTDPFQHLFRQNATFLSLPLQPPQRKDVPSNDKMVPTSPLYPPTTEMVFYTLHDAYIRIPLDDIIDPTHLSTTTSNTTTPSIYGHHWRDDILDIGYDQALFRGIVRTLRYALNDRIVNIQAIIVEGMNAQNDTNILRVSDTSDATTIKNKNGSHKKEKQKKIGNNVVKTTKYMVIGVTINPDTCYRVVDRCMTDEVDKGTGTDNSHELSQLQHPTSGATDPQHSLGVQRFLELWGDKAGLRRFKDGAIVYAAVWDDKSHIIDNNDTSSSFCLRYQNDDTWQGGIVECIIRHVLKMHFLRPGGKTVPRFMLRDLVSMIDGVVPTISDSVTSTPLLTNPMFAHRSVMKAFDTLSEWLRTNSKPTIPIPGSATAMKSVLGIPLTIDRVEPLSAALRYVALYPPIPHPLLITKGTGLSSASMVGQKKCAGAVQFDPIHIQICFSSSSKWPNDVKAIGAAKTAMLVEIVNGIVKLKASGVNDTICNFFNETSMLVTPSHADIPFMGYVFRVTIKADHEIRILQNLQNPSKDAERMLHSYVKQSVIAAKHHALIHGVYTSHPSSSATVRLVKRWLSSHLLPSDSDSGYGIPFEVIELSVAHVYTNLSNLLRPPATVTSGFMRWLYFVIDFDWQGQPLVVDPQHHMNDADHCTILDQFEIDRGENFDRGPPWYIVAPYDEIGKTETSDDNDNTSDTRRKRWSPSFAATYPERVVASRIIALARRTYSFLQTTLMRYDDIGAKSSDSIWHSVFQESRDSFLSYSALLRIDPTFLVNSHASSSANAQNLSPRKIMTKTADGNDVEIFESTYTNSMHSLSLGPKDLQKKMYRNLMIATGDDNDNNLIVLTEWQPVRAMLQSLQSRLGKLLLIFYNDLYPDVIGIVWRQPNMFQSRTFSALTSEFARPVTTDHWLPDTMISYNVFDVLRTISLYTDSFVTDVKVLDHGQLSTSKIDKSSDGKSVRKEKRIKNV